MTALARTTTATLLDAGVSAFKDGDLQLALDNLAQATKSAPADPEPHYWIHAVLSAAGQSEAAQFALSDARTLHGLAFLRAAGGDATRMQTDKAYAAQLGRELYALRYMAAASVALGRALDFEKPNAELLVTYGLSLQHQGRIQESLDVFRAAGELFSNSSVHEFLLFPLFHVADRGHAVRAAAEAWAATYAAPFIPLNPVYANERTSERRLKIGYVAPSITRTQLAQFILPVLEAHDPQAVDVYLYCGGAESEDALPATVTQRPMSGLSDDEVAAQVRADGIDILVDLWGHTAGGRLNVFARRPAPVQIAWVNFVQTTGLSAIDYVMHADSMDAPGTADMFVEEVWRMGEIMVPFRPLPDRPDVAPTPALRNGFVTFGSFNNPAKLSDETIDAWSAILRARPNDRLVLKYGLFIDPVLQRATRSRFEARGVDGERLEFRGESKGQAYLAEFQDIDLALDPSPCPGGTTTCDALSNGVPVLTLKGRDFYARIGLPAILPCGLPELVAENWDDYIGRALALTADAHHLDMLRQRVRPGFEASGYRDEVGFTRGLEAQYRQMFQRWLDKTSA